VRSLLRQIPYSALLLIAIFMAIAPLTPQPHLVEKLGLLMQLQLVRPIDIFDLLFHAAPLLLLAAKLVLERIPEPGDRN